MQTVGRLVVAAIAGYVVGLAAGLLLVKVLSSNQHDRSTEAAMTAGCVVGPLGAVVAMIVAWFAWIR